jgi:hypothetical protein
MDFPVGHNRMYLLFSQHLPFLFVEVSIVVTKSSATICGLSILSCFRLSSEQRIPSSNIFEQGYVGSGTFDACHFESCV